MKTLIFILLLASLPHGKDLSVKDTDLLGAWKTTLSDGSNAVCIITESYFSVTFFQENTPRFISTFGGKWSAKGNQVSIEYEYNTENTYMVGKKETRYVNVNSDRLYIDDTSWERIDDGTPGKLAGAWLITGREREGKMGTITPGARKTMKILSGKYFQWIAYNTETGEFFGTGGGTYTTKGGKYTENIKFFSRDNARVGASLEFDFEVKEGKWHHKGFSSKGDPMYEIWSQRKDIGI
ncbi:MAG: membrane or secreted protein [Cyclobacteriaceae bacterium]|nr:membrane or secreted protein [Cyclobacteriaceae bacterium]